VIVEGWKNQTEVRELYRRADIFALASFAEGVPVVLMEAMAMQLPCVATRITGIPELIRDGIDGLLVTPSDAAELAVAIARLIDDPGLRRRLAAAGRVRVEEKYHLATNVARLGEIFRRRLSS
jgi:glycosyltransferase involved in cell wall biosynthesis